LRTETADEVEVGLAIQRRSFTFSKSNLEERRCAGFLYLITRVGDASIILGVDKTVPVHRAYANDNSRSDMRVFAE
jgi:hypothetical protein